MADAEKYDSFSQFDDRPDRESVSRFFGFPAPASLVELIQQVWDFADGDPELAALAFTDALHIEVWGNGMRYTCTPIEVFSLGTTGSNGEHLGYVLHAEELGEQELPLGFVGPAGFEFVQLVGQTTAEALDRTLSFSLAWSEQELADADEEEIEEDEDLQEAVRRRDVALALASAFGIAPAPGKYSEQEWIADAKRTPQPPTIPAGYRYVPTDDGIGVLAPESAFGPEQLPSPADIPFAFDWVAAAQQALASGHPANALYYLRQGLRHGLLTWRESGDSLVQTYQALGRPLLAAHARAHADEQSQGGC